jgi:putative two-component system response regulator
MKSQYHKILIVDDIEENLFLLERVLEAPKRKFIRATEAKKALEILSHQEIALIILDVQMPGLNGFEAAKIIRQNPKTKYIPIIFVTALSYELKNEFMGYEVGAVDYMTKPLKIEIFRSKVNIFLQLNDLVKKANLETIYRLSIAAEFRDNKNTGHLERISEYSNLLAKEMDLADDYIEIIKLASPMHDIGKIGIADHIIFKPGEYTTAELKEMQRHPQIGHLILKDSNSELIQMADRIAFHHHERVNGGGYPRGLKGEEIPLEARIVAVADVYDALREARVYKPAFSREKSINIMKEKVGSHFDKNVFLALLGVLDKIETIRSNFKLN